MADTTYKPSDPETCRPNPCGEDCDYMAVSVFNGLGDFLQRRAAARRQPGHNYSDFEECRVCGDLCILRPFDDWDR